MNTLRRGSLLKVGMKIKVPSEDEGIPVAPDSDQVIPSRGPQAVIPIAHVVKVGETLTSIAKKYGVTIDAIKKANNLKRKSTLKVGSRLVIPVSASTRYGKNHQLQAGVFSRSAMKVKKTKFHIVRRGENLHDIADRYNVSVGNLREKNKIARNSKLFVGVKLLIPNAEARAIR